MSRNKHLTKLCMKCPLHVKYVLFEWEIWSDRLSRQRSNYMHILMNHCLNSDKHDTDDRQDSFWLFEPGMMDANLPCCLTNHMVSLWLVLLASHQLFNRSVISCVCSVRSPFAWNFFCRPIFGPINCCKQAVKSPVCPISLWKFLQKLSWTVTF